MSCKIVQMGNEKLTYLTCWELREQKEKMIEKFIKTNGFHNEKDRALIAYRNSLNEILDKCKCLEKCRTCIESDHEGVFCRCEERNMKVAKQQRKDGKSSWKLRPLKSTDQ